MRLIILALFICAGFIACDRQMYQDGLKPRKSIVQGQNSSVTKKKTYVIATEQEWAKLWNEIYQHISPVPELPEINFKENFIVAVFSGTRPTGGYSIEIADFEAENGFLTVKVVETIPGKNCMVTQAITSPFHVVEVPKGRYRQIKFETEEVVNGCDE